MVYAKFKTEFIIPDSTTVIISLSRISFEEAQIMIRNSTGSTNHFIAPFSIFNDSGLIINKISFNSPDFGKFYCLNKNNLCFIKIK